ncbi:tumor necrosis factor ligand superfamily member 13B isoform X5 [Accipiter gentilis]|uniref:tumor necrosis factor ligand superfamily member 13B isoform X5 n=1 Tax=Astur gentilis TaxID=8957 RepID=UPI002110DBC1|nr:tumor necrosis factor ligand superfamily member 13B isoform X5 [Accipiter gentilis]
MKSVDCVHVIQQKDTASSPSAPPGAASGTAGLFSVTFLWLAMLLSSCLAAVSLYHVIALKTELEALRSKLIYRVQARSLLDQPPVSSDENKAGTPASSFLRASAAGTGQENRLPGPGPAESFQKEIWNGSGNRGRRSVVHTEERVLQACLQLIADSKSDIQQKDDSSIVPWLLSFKRGTALEEQGNKIVIKETGYFFIYGQVLYTDTTFAMGHLIQRKKAHVFGDDLSLVTLFRCIQNMPQSYPNNSCYTAGFLLPKFPPFCFHLGNQISLQYLMLLSTCRSRCQMRSQLSGCDVKAKCFRLPHQLVDGWQEADFCALQWVSWCLVTSFGR